uniref:Uncharacterized protein n=1 Tax=Glossina pallidipes TaxID=7398 RepID=A0A1B0A4S2_GLOPL
MGANKSAPQTIPIDPVQLYVSPSVVSRLESVRRQEAETSNVKTFENDSTDHTQNCQQQPMGEEQQHQQNEAKLLYKRGRGDWIHHSSDLSGNECSKLADHQFAESKEILGDSLSKALQRTENIDIKIQKLRNQLIACHRDHPEFVFKFRKRNVETWKAFYSRKLGLPSKVQPLRCMICDAAQIPQCTQTSKSLFCMYCARKPPQKASPAAVVSTICSGLNFGTGYSLIVHPWKASTGSGP